MIEEGSACWLVNLLSFSCQGLFESSNLLSHCQQGGYFSKGTALVQNFASKSHPQCAQYSDTVTSGRVVEGMRFDYCLGNNQNWELWRASLCQLLWLKNTLAMIWLAFYYGKWLRLSTVDMAWLSGRANCRLVWQITTNRPLTNQFLQMEAGKMKANEFRNNFLNSVISRFEHQKSSLLFITLQEKATVNFFLPQRDFRFFV